MSKKVSRLEVYQYATGTHKDGGGFSFSAKKIANFLGVSRQYISLLLQEMVVGGYLVCSNPKGNEKFYTATTRIYDGEKTNISDGMESTNLGRRPGIILQKTRYEINIKHEYTKFFNDKKSWIWGNCPCSKYNVKIFDNFDNFEFRKIGKKKLIVIVPGMCFKKYELSIAQHTIFLITYEALKWFAKKAKIRFDWTSLHLCQKPHVTRAAQAAWAKRVANNWSLSIDGKMLDSSSGKADWESEIFDDNIVNAVDALENWDNIAVMQQQIEKLQLSHNDIDIRQNFMEKKVDEILSSVIDLKNMFRENQNIVKKRMNENLERGMFN